MAMNLDAVLKISAQVIGQDGVDRLRSSIGGLSGVAESAKKGFGDMVKSASFQALAAGAAGVGVALGTSVREAVKFESAMADVRKVVPGLESADGLREMKGAIIDLSRELPISAQGLAEIVAAAGQAGIEKNQLVEFARAAAQMAVAFDMTAGEAGDAMAKLRTSMGLNQEEVVNLADAMNYLSNVQASSASQITDFMLRVGAFGQQVAMTEEQTAALGSAMIAAGAAPDVAATSFRNLIKEMAAGQNATKKQESAWAQLGLSANEVAKRMQTDAVPTIRDVFQRIAALPKEMQIPIAEVLFGNEARAITPLLKNMKLFDESMAAVGNRTNYAGSMLAEFAARSGTSANSWQLLMNNVKALQIAIGDALIPALNLLMGILTPVISLIARGAQQFPWLTTAIVAITAAFVGLVAIMPLIASFLYALAQLSAMGVTFAGIGAIIGGLGATIAGFLGAVGPILAGIMAVFSGAFAAIGGALTTLGTILVGVFSGPVGWIALLVAAAAALFVFREPIMAFFAWVGQAFTAWIASLALWAAPFTAWWDALWGQVRLITGSFFEWLGQGLYQWFVQPWITLGEQIIPLVAALWDNVRAPAIGFFGWFGAGLYAWLVQPWITAGQGIVTAAMALWGTLKDPIIGFFGWWSANLYLWFVEPWVVTGSKIGQLAVQMWGGVKAAASAAGQWLQTSVQRWIVDPWNSVVAQVTNIARQMWEGVKSTATSAGQWLLGVVQQWIVQPWNGVRAQVVSYAMQMWEGVKGAAAAAGQWIAGAVQALFVDPFVSARDLVITAWGQLGTMIMGAWTNITSAFDQYVTQPIQAAWSALQTWMASAAQGIAAALQQAYNAIAGGIVGAFRGIVGTVGRVVNGIIGMINSLIDGINRVRSAVGLSALLKIPMVNLPAFAQGGVVNRPTVALVGEGGEPEYIIPESKMASAAMNYLDGARNQAVLMARAPRPLNMAGSGGGAAGGGAGGVQVNITTGPVLDQGGQKYVTLQDLEGAVRQTATQIYATLRTPSGRRSMGLA